MAVRPFEEQIYRSRRSSHMEYTGNGIQNWFLKEMALFIYYVKAPLRGLLKEIPENHLFHLGLETPACILHLTQLSRLKQQNWKELYIRFQLTVVHYLWNIFFTIFLWFTARHHLTQPCLFVCPSVRQYLYMRPAKDLVMGLSAHDQTFAFRVILTVQIWKNKLGLSCTKLSLSCS